MSRVMYVTYTILNCVMFPKKLQHLRTAALQKIQLKKKATHAMSKMSASRI